MKKIKFYFKRLYEIIMTPSMSYLPGNIAFFLVLSIFPILTLIGVIASKFSLDLSMIIDLEEIVLPSNLSELLASFIQGKGFDTNIGIFMIIGFFLASNGAAAIILASNNLYGFPNSDYLKRRIKSIFIIVLIIFLFIFMMIFLAFGNKLIALLLNYIKDPTLVKMIYYLFVILKWPFALFIIFFNVKLIYTIAPDWKIMSKHTTKGALFTTISWILVVQIYSFWVNHFSNYDLFYGSLSNIIVLMLMIYFISYILVIGIAINVKSYEYKVED